MKIPCEGRNPQSRRTATRRKMLEMWRRSPRWKKLVADHAHVPEVSCAHCNMYHGQQRCNSIGEPSFDKNGKPIRVVLTINHKTRDLYFTEDRYLTWHPEKMEVCCTICNKQYEKGMIPCPKCLTAGYAKYIHWYDEICATCFFRDHPQELEKITQARADFAQAVKEYNAKKAKTAREAKKKHPCRYRLVSGRCQKSTTGTHCPFSAAKATKNCWDFVAKKRIK